MTVLGSQAQPKATPNFYNGAFFESVRLDTQTTDELQQVHVHLQNL